MHRGPAWFLPSLADKLNITERGKEDECPELGIASYVVLHGTSQILFLAELELCKVKQVDEMTCEYVG